MKLIILVAVALAAVAVAAPPEPPKILRSEFNSQPQGYDFGFETEDGISRSENGEVKEILDEDKKPHVVVVQRGSFSYTDPDGKPQFITYYADENGYHAEGDAIPKVTSRR